MSPRDLIHDPCWQGNDLGHPLPDATHAVSVALPRWSDVIAYEENDPACRSKLQAVYPRFGFHPLVQELALQALAESQRASSTDFSSWPYSSRAAAKAAQTHCQRRMPAGFSTMLLCESRTRSRDRRRWLSSKVGTPDS